MREPPPPFEPWVREVLGKMSENVADIHAKVIVHDVDLACIKAELAWRRAQQSPPPSFGGRASESGLHWIDNRGKVMPHAEALRLWEEEQLKADGKIYRAWWQFGKGAAREVIALVIAAVMIALLSAHLGMAIAKP